MPAMKVFPNRPPMKKVIVVDDHDIVRLFIKRCREDAQLTLTAFAPKLGITKAALSSYENKGSIIPLKKIVKFLAILGYRLEIRKIEDLATPSSSSSFASITSPAPTSSAE